MFESVIENNIINEPLDINIDLNSYPQSWYPICASHKLKTGKLLIQHAFGKDWILFRDQKNQVGMLSRHCQHMGADLANGRIVNGQIECPLHHWRYDNAGLCKNLSKQENPYSLYALPIMEIYGLVFAFWGKQPYFFPSLFKHLQYPVISSPVDITIQTPFMMLAMNTFDTNHYLSVHSRKLVGTPEVYSQESHHLGIRYQAEIKPGKLYDRLFLLFGRQQVTNQIDCWGGNIFLISNKDTTIYAMVGVLPVNNKTTKIFIIASCEKSRSLWGKIFIDHFKCYLGRVFTKEFLKPDFPALKNMHPNFSHPSIKNDALLLEFFQYWEKLPKFT